MAAGNIHLSFGRIQVLKDASFNIKQDDILSIIGPKLMSLDEPSLGLNLSGGRRSYTSVKHYKRHKHWLGLCCSRRFLDESHPDPRLDNYPNTPSVPTLIGRN